MKKLFTPGIRILWFTLAVLNMLYGAMVFLVGSGTLSFAIWIFGALFFLLLYFLAGKKRWSKLPKLIRNVFCIIVSICVLAGVILSGAMLSHFGDKGEKDMDYIIVLGAQMRSYGPSVIFRYRLDAAYKYMQENPDCICIVSGAQGVNEHISEGEGGREYLIAKGIPEDRVIAETNSFNTVQNVKYSMDIIGGVDNRPEKELKIGVVTNNYHLFRGIHLAMAETEGEVSGIAGHTVPRFLPNNMVRECFGILRDLRKMKF